MKVLFLDIDGVLNSKRTCVAFDGYPHSFDGRDMERFDHVAINLVRELCKVTDCSVVLSSDWRLSSTVHEAANALDLPIIDRTPLLRGCRGLEINAWLAEHPEIETYAIVDDNDGMLESQLTRFVKTDEEFGLTLRDFVDLKRILGIAQEA